MIHPFFTRLVSQPGLFVEHAGAYAELATAEVKHFGSMWQRRAALAAIATLTALLALGTTAVAIMMAAAIDWRSMPAPWLLVAVPGTLWAVTVATGVAAWRTRVQPMFSVLRQQVAADVAMLNRAGQS